MNKLIDHVTTNRNGHVAHAVTNCQDTPYTHAGWINGQCVCWGFSQDAVRQSTQARFPISHDGGFVYPKGWSIEVTTVTTNQ